MTDFERLPFRVRGIIERCRNGQRLQKHFQFKASGETEVIFTFEPSGKKAGPKSADVATKTEFLVPAGDGLFAKEDSQTWLAK